MTDRPVDLERVRSALARLDALSREHPEAFADVPRLLVAIRRRGPTGHEAAEAARAALKKICREDPELAAIMTPDAWATWELAIAAIEAFDDGSEET